ncbi:MAG: hypothetical protein K6F97_10835 [Lachnospiraceae bacterium]|nr:hypothetical protein [Lachnospiraceae bacterium]
MRRIRNRRTVFFAALLGMCVTFLGGCEGNKEKPSSSLPASTTVTPYITVDQGSSTIIDKENKAIVYYTVDPSTGEKEPGTAYMEKGEVLNAEYICTFEADIISGDISDVVIDSVTENENTVIVSFTKDSAPASGLSKKIEQYVLDCFAQSLIENLDYCKKVIFRIEGEAYVSNNLSYDKDFVYLEKSMK